MLTLDQHFSSGFLPAVTGAYFNLSALLAAHADSPVPEVRHAVTEEVPRLRTTGARVKDNVRMVQALTELAGLPVPPPPRVPDEYFSWFELVHEGFTSRLRGESRSELTHRAGHHVGDVLCAWNVYVLALRLLISDPGSPRLAQPRAALREDLRRSASALVVVAAHSNLPAALVPLVELVQSAVTELLDQPATGLGVSALAGFGQTLNDRMREMSRAVSFAEGGLRAEANTADA